MGRYQIALHGVGKLEETRFHDAVEQLFSPIDNPRHIIATTSGLFRRRYQYFPVPERFERNKTLAATFWKHWQGYVGRGQLVYTRTVWGRGALQAARLSSADRKVKTNMQWR
ncbi:hypothetical protein [Thioclava indica]|uniref:Uncharacterized protein n=1 Tax=Thioclava indica TaxID=1353528 RepID=A0A074JNL8_9RHOB|nr:hypothetical protein [Thioclava indica]KEO57183.1 hypothetical protein DT23_17090 [Thioclava indica]